MPDLFKSRLKQLEDAYDFGNVHITMRGHVWKL